jgi:Fe2+ transport system protein FeoA
MTLSDLQQGDKATIIDCSSCPLRFAEMGLIDGTEISVVSKQGDTIALQYKNSSLCVRCRECPLVVALKNHSC